MGTLNYSTDAEQDKQLEHAFHLITNREGWADSVVVLNEKMLQLGRWLYTRTPKCPEQVIMLQKIKEAQFWAEQAIKKQGF